MLLTKTQKPFLTIHAFAFILFVINMIFFDAVAEHKIDYLSVASEGLIAIALSATLYNISLFKFDLKSNLMANIGFGSLFIAFSVDTMDELFQQHSAFSALFEATLQAFGFIVVVFTIKNWQQHNIQQNEKLVALATTDPLTGLFTRRYFEEQFEKERKRCERSHQPFSIAILDIDHFKSINDVYGHEAGDISLQDMSKDLLAMIRKSDTVARWGGEEFILLMPDTNLEQAQVFAEKIRSSIENSIVHYREHEIDFTVSIGLTDYQPKDRDLNDTLDRADGYLYHAKHTGRNRVVHFIDKSVASKKAKGENEQLTSSDKKEVSNSEPELANAPSQ